ncbi:MAG: cell division protease FtsH, partial [Thermoleophilaceae bacterium]|nr:cell division protease FtsH [Thermoleophilaceae bacterium]
IDEIDAVGMRRQSLGGARSETADEAWDRAYFGRHGAKNPSGDLIVENRAWRDWMFTQRAPESVAPYPAWMRKLGNIVNQGIFPGMGGMGGGMALNQLLVVMDGIDNPPFGKRVFTNKVNSFLDAIYVVPRRVGKRAGLGMAAVLTLGGSLLLLNDLVNLAGGSPLVDFMVGGSPFWQGLYIVLDILIIFAGIMEWRHAKEKGTVSLRLPKARPTGAQIYFIGATNVPLDMLDPALIRPGRMGRHVTFRTPTKDDRKDIFDLYLDKVAHDPDLDKLERRDEIARITNGYSPAMIDQICSMALTNAHHEGRPEFTWMHLVEAMTVVESGTAVGVQYTEGEAKATAIHEAGHAVAAHVYRPNVESSRLSIKMRGRSHGHHQSFEKEERFGHFQSELFADLIHGLGAMAAEHVFYAENTNGVGGDLFGATSDAATMVGQWGMAPEPLRFADSGEEVTVPQWLRYRAPDRPGQRDREPFGPGGDSFDDESPEQTRERLVLQRFELIGLRLMNRTRGAAQQGDPIAAVLMDPRKRILAAQFLGQAFVIAYNLMAANKQAVEHIADTLVEKKELYGDDLIRLLDAQNLQKPELDWTKEETWPKV